MNDQLPPTAEEPKKMSTGMIIAIVAVVLLCCCCIGVIALYFGYDNLGDPLGIYSSLPQLKSLLLA